MAKKRRSTGKIGPVEVFAECMHSLMAEAWRQMNQEEYRRALLLVEEIIKKLGPNGR